MTEAHVGTEYVRVYVAEGKYPSETHHVLLTDQANHVLPDKTKGIFVGESSFKSDLAAHELKPGDRFYVRFLPRLQLAEVDVEEIAVHDVLRISCEVYDAMRQEYERRAAHHNQQLAAWLKEWADFRNAMNEKRKSLSPPKLEDVVREQLGLHD